MFAGRRKFFRGPRVRLLCARIPTSSETLVDHICTNNQSKKYLSGITLSADLSDHLGTFILLYLQKNWTGLMSATYI